jgi:hypothetical protein
MVDFPIIIKGDQINLYNNDEEEYITYKLVDQMIDDEFTTTVVNAVDKNGKKCIVTVTISKSYKDSGVNVFFEDENWGYQFYGDLLK